MKKLLVAALMVFSSTSLASEFTPYAGLNGGLHSTQGVSGEASKAGFSLNGKVLGSWEFPQYLVDVGVGYQYMELTSSGVKITTKSVTGELESRYKFSQEWSAGVGVKVAGGTDNTNSEVIGSTTLTTSVLAKVVYQTSLGSNPFRVELGAGQTVGLDRNQTTVMAGVQIALPWTKPAPAPVVVRSVEQQPDIRIDLKMAQVRFGTDKFELSDKDEAKLNRLAKFLRENNTEWSRIKISGHTDSTGDATYNKALSQDRADSVMKLFIRGGVDEIKMSSHGYGSNRPVDATNSPDAWSKNRRTEIEFYGVKNRLEFNRQLLNVLK